MQRCWTKKFINLPRGFSTHETISQAATVRLVPTMPPFGLWIINNESPDRYPSCGTRWLRLVLQRAPEISVQINRV